MLFMVIYVLWFMNQDDTVLKISWSIYIYTNAQKHYCEMAWMVLDDPTAIKMHALKGRCMPSVFCSSKG